MTITEPLFQQCPKINGACKFMITEIFNGEYVSHERMLPAKVVQLDTGWTIIPDTALNEYQDAIIYPIWTGK